MSETPKAPRVMFEHEELGGFYYSDGGEPEKYIAFIEYSAYLELARENERLTHDFFAMSDREETAIIQRDSLQHENRSLIDKLTLAREALEFVVEHLHGVTTREPVWKIAREALEKINK